MTAYEFSNLWVPARNNYIRYLGVERGNNMRFHSNKMERLIGAYAYKYSDWHAGQGSVDYPMSNELREILLALTGPHANTMFKVLEIRKGATHDVE